MDSNSLDHEAPSEPTLAEINRSKTAKSGGSSEIDFFISRRGGAAAIAQEVADILKTKAIQSLFRTMTLPIRRILSVRWMTR